MGLFLSLWSRPSTAQLAPTGGHYGGRASDTGTSPGAVNASGGYSASIPLELPASQGGLPVPISISSGTRGVGAVGLGWDIPLSYIRRDMSFAHRKPQVTSTVLAGREQVTLFLQGQVLDLVPRQVSAGPPQVVHWLPRYNAPDLLLQEQASTWVMHDGDGRAWTFTALTGLEGTGLWLLTSITGPGNTAVQLHYSISRTPVPGGSLGLTIDLRQLLYNQHPSGNCFKNEIALNYGWPGAAMSLSLLGDRVLTRARSLNTLDVSSRATCASLPEKLRTYTFAYGIDPDTQHPRLDAVTMQGRQGTPEQAIALPIASYTYGNATTNGRLTYAKTASIPMPTGSDPSGLDAGCIGKECQGGGGGFPGQPGGGGGPSAINDPSLYLPGVGASGGSADPAATSRVATSVASFTQSPTGPRTPSGVVLKTPVQLMTGIKLGSSFDYDSLAARGFTVGQVADQLANTPEGARQISKMMNAFKDQLSSFGQGVGDVIIFWCPGCTEHMRKTWGITSGGDSNAYMWGSITGIIGSIMAMNPSAFVPAPKVTVEDFRQYLHFKGADKVQVLPCTTNCTSTTAAVEYTLAGRPMAAGPPCSRASAGATPNPEAGGRGPRRRVPAAPR
ncbi:hypothetical protein SAMN05443572_10397 [Myxococcus fulvus]|uniref:Uncharacterized protein n=1 Tax=Myxococcus fulvus TaxID=33 RepID=A0A511TGA8_MYXFU|nr:hypothetical protein [Myxococcus fulvus]GEN12412.1 hypothetical protein MFU01_74490 [Myxococcus fulvus]SET75911.1 hypothetical protein SAMN05443572_10397 [Myxococcus fulvus]